MTSLMILRKITTITLFMIWIILKKGAVLDKTSLSIMADKSADGSFNDINIPQTDIKVNSDTSTKYFMPLNKHNTQELDNSSFFYYLL